MAKFLRFRDDNRPFFVTTNTHQRRPIFTDPNTAKLLLQVIYQTRTKYGFHILSFVIMPDHLHAIIVASPRNDITQVMRYIKGSFSRAYHETKAVGGPVWQDSFHDRGIRDERSLSEFVRYIEDNPVKAGLVSRASDYQFSSANNSTDIEAYFGSG